MQALRIIEQVVDHRLTLELPEYLWERRVEVIVMPADDIEIPARTARRKPSELLAATRITGDIISPALPSEDWDALR